MQEFCRNGHLLDEGNIYLHRKNGRISRHCKRCVADKCARRYAASPESYADAHLRRKYGRTLSEKRELCNLQNQQCANLGCGHVFTSLSDAQWDHSHKTSQVRGLLCAACNRTLGIMKENLLSIAGLIGYLQKFEKE